MSKEPRVGRCPCHSFTNKYIWIPWISTNDHFVPEVVFVKLMIPKRESVDEDHVFVTQGIFHRVTTAHDDGDTKVLNTVQDTSTLNPCLRPTPNSIHHGSYDGYFGSCHASEGSSEESS